MTARPLPQGQYTYYYIRDGVHIPCDSYPVELEGFNLHTVDVASSGAVHEALFDSTAALNDTGATAESGLTPASFELDGKEVVLEELVWREGQVLLSASPDLSPEKHRLDIIGLDGSVALRLSFDHAVSNSEAAQRARS